MLKQQSIGHSVKVEPQSIFSLPQADGLSVYEKHAIALITTRAFETSTETGKSYGGKMRLSASFVAEMMNVGESKAKQVLGSLTERGYLEKTQSNRIWGNLYRVVRPVFVPNPFAQIQCQNDSRRVPDNQPSGVIRPYQCIDTDKKEIIQEKSDEKASASSDVSANPKKVRAILSKVFGSTQVDKEKKKEIRRKVRQTFGDRWSEKPQFERKNEENAFLQILAKHPEDLELIQQVLQYCESRIEKCPKGEDLFGEPIRKSVVAFLRGTFNNGEQEKTDVDGNPLPGWPELKHQWERINTLGAERAEAAKGGEAIPTQDQQKVTESREARKKMNDFDQPQDQQEGQAVAEVYTLPPADFSKMWRKSHAPQAPEQVTPVAPDTAPETPVAKAGKGIVPQVRSLGGKSSLTTQAHMKAAQEQLAALDAFLAKTPQAVQTSAPAAEQSVAADALEDSHLGPEIPQPRETVEQVWCEDMASPVANTESEALQLLEDSAIHELETEAHVSEQIGDRLVGTGASIAPVQSENVVVCASEKSCDADVGVAAGKNKIAPSVIAQGLVEYDLFQGIPITNSEIGSQLSDVSLREAGPLSVSQWSLFSEVKDLVREGHLLARDGGEMQQQLSAIGNDAQERFTMPLTTLGYSPVRSPHLGPFLREWVGAETSSELHGRGPPPEFIGHFAVQYSAT